VNENIFYSLINLDMDISEQRQKQFMEEGLIDNLPQTLFQKNRNQFIKMFREAYEQVN
jgi:hypothetical protein